MAVVTGAILGGYLLSEEDFIEICKDFITKEENAAHLKYRIANILKSISNRDIREAYKQTMSLHQNFLQNKEDITLLVITNLSTDSNEYSWKYEAHESVRLTKSGLLQNSKLIKEELFAAQVRQVISEHLRELLKEVSTANLTNQQIQLLFSAPDFDNKSDFGKRAHDSRSLKYIMYGNKNDSSWMGQVADAFLQHLGNLHSEVLNDEDVVEPIKRSVWEEEGDAHFFQLLRESTNNVSWFTGGDLILLDANHKVIANIQLKSTTKENSSTLGSISTAKLQTSLKQLLELLNSNLEQEAIRIAKKMYQTFKTSGIISQVENTINNKVIPQTLEPVTSMNKHKIKEILKLN